MKYFLFFIFFFLISCQKYRTQIIMMYDKEPLYACIPQKACCIDGLNRNDTLVIGMDTTILYFCSELIEDGAINFQSTISKIKDKKLEKINNPNDNGTDLKVVKIGNKAAERIDSLYISAKNGMIRYHNNYYSKDTTLIRFVFGNVPKLIGKTWPDLYQSIYHSH